MAFYRTIRALFRLIAALIFRFRVEGRERLPTSGAAIVVAPHRSWLDPACVGGACPRPVRFLILDRVFHYRWLRWFYRAMGAIPVTQGGPEAIGALREALRQLRRGEIVGVFPEGRVLPEGSLGRVHPGAAMLAVRLQAPVIPIVIRGSARAWPHGRLYPLPAAVRVVIGEAVRPCAGRGREAVDRTVSRIERALVELDARAENPRA